jgi:hypothetical protein
MLLGILLACQPGKPARISTQPEKGSVPLILEIKTGDTWVHNQKMMAFNLKIIPQIAVWVEDTEGRYIDTLYVSKAFGRQVWQFVEVDPDVTLRDKSLPVWMNRRLAAGIHPPTKNTPLADTVTGATPKGDFTLTSSVPAGLRQFVIFVEINKSFDGNETFFGTWDGSDAGFTEEVINGQPSVLYSVRVDLDNLEDTLMLVLAGHGGVSGQDGTLYTDTSGLTTALDMIETGRVILP